MSSISMLSGEPVCCPGIFQQAIPEKNWSQKTHCGSVHFLGGVIFKSLKKPEKPETDPDIANEIGEFLMILRRFAFNFVSLMNTGASSSALGNGDFLRPRNVGCGKSGGGPRVSPLFWEGKYGMDSDKGHLGLEGFLLQVSD